jgi:hypothetical protein
MRIQDWVYPRQSSAAMVRAEAEAALAATNSFSVCNPREAIRRPMAVVMPVDRRDCPGNADAVKDLGGQALVT